MTTSKTQPASKFVQANGITLHYAEWSTDGPPLIFLHGITNSFHAWDQIAPVFIDDYRVLTFDLRGHGQSEKPESEFSVADDYASDIAEFIATQLEEPAILVGHSLGAIISAPVAVKVGEKVRAIVMEDPPSFAGRDPERGKNLFAWILDVKKLPFDERVKFLMEQQGFERDLAIRRATNFGDMSPRVLEVLFAGGTIYEPSDLLPKVTCPAMVLLGNPEHGGVIQMSDRSEFRSLMPNAKIVEWSDVGHGIHSEQPERFIAEVKAFLSSL